MSALSSQSGEWGTALGRGLVRFQSKPWWCGPASIQTALLCLGIHKSQREIASRIHCTEELGTDETEVIRALLSWGCKVDPFGTTQAFDARNWLDNFSPAIVCFDNWDHWCCFLGKSGERYLTFDPINSTMNRRMNGVHVYTWEQLRTRWRCDGAFYGIGVSL